MSSYFSTEGYFWNIWGRWSTGCLQQKLLCYSTQQCVVCFWVQWFAVFTPPLKKSWEEATVKSLLKKLRQCSINIEWFKVLEFDSHVSYWLIGRFCCINNKKIELQYPGHYLTIIDVLIKKKTYHLSISPPEEAFPDFITERTLVELKFTQYSVCLRFSRLLTMIWLYPHQFFVVFRPH